MIFHIDFRAVRMGVRALVMVCTGLIPVLNMFATDMLQGVPSAERAVMQSLSADESFLNAWNDTSQQFKDDVLSALKTSVQENPNLVSRAIENGTLVGEAVNRMESEAFGAIKAGNWEDAYGRLVALVNATRNSSDRLDVEKAGDLIQLSMLCWNTNRKKQAGDILTRAIDLLKTGQYLGVGCEARAVALKTRMDMGVQAGFSVNDIVGASGAYAQIIEMPINVLVQNMSTAMFGERNQACVQYPTTDQVRAQYQAWFQNAGIQLRGQIAGQPLIVQIQIIIRACECELAQWGSFLQQHYPMLYATRISQLQQYRQLLVRMMNGGGQALSMPVPFPRVSSGGGYANRCIACGGGARLCKQCTGTGIVHASYGGSGSWTCTACKGSGRCSVCSEIEIRRLD